MESLYKKLPGILVCLAIAIPSYLLGKFVPVVGGAIFSILIGMVIAKARLHQALSSHQSLYFS